MGTMKEWWSVNDVVQVMGELVLDYEETGDREELRKLRDAFEYLATVCGSGLGDPF